MTIAQLEEMELYENIAEASLLVQAWHDDHVLEPGYDRNALNDSAARRTLAINLAIDFTAKTKGRQWDGEWLEEIERYVLQALA